MKTGPFWELEKELKFEAAHYMPLYDGPCCNIHGHSWRVRIVCRFYHIHTAGALMGMAADYARLKSSLEETVNKMDHSILNSLAPELEHPSCEVLSKYLFDCLKAKDPNLAPDVYKIVIHETSVNTCTYYPYGDNA